MIIKRLSLDELEAAVPFIFKVFMQYDAPFYGQQGIDMFKNSVGSREYLEKLKGYGGFIDEKLVGIIATRNDNHVALFFVDGDYQHQGIGRALLEKALSETEAKIVTVHSSLYAMDIYKALGFVAMGGIQDKGIQYLPMAYPLMMKRLMDKDDKKAYQYCKKLSAESTLSNENYAFFDDYLTLLKQESSFARTRGFVLCCQQAKWDVDRKIEKNLKELLALLHDEKPTVIRQCIKNLEAVLLYLPDLQQEIKAELLTIDVNQYKDSMAPLIQKDIDGLLKNVD